MGAVEGKQLDAHEVVSRSNALRHGEVVPATIGDHCVYSPGSVVVEAILGDLEPLQIKGGGDARIIHRSEINGDGPLGLSA